MPVEPGPVHETDAPGAAGAPAAPRPAGRVRQLRLVVEVDDHDAAVAFFRDVLGMAEEIAYDGAAGERVVILDAGRATLELANTAHRRAVDELETGSPDGPRVRLALEVDDTAARTAELLAAGAAPIAPPTQTPWRSLNARVHSPAGLTVTLFQELEPPEEQRRHAGLEG
ncbi:VOC family protein [Georgenia yuyongxinii]|uniref:VOC family protein n=1 Tax=Georgenia yuyongxinii TaxID=2589797 RepID=UPI001E3AAADB|nr:VOC family protein [Georgenia yuyongxinii]